MANSQAILFLLFALNGVIIGILFDFFRILRRSFPTGSILTAIEDIIFWILAGIIMLYSIFLYNNGVIRGYMFLGVFCGASLYMLTLSSIFIKINVYILNFIKKIIVIIVKLFGIPIKIIFKPISYIINTIIRFFDKIIKNNLNFRKKSKKLKI